MLEASISALSTEANAKRALAVVHDVTDRVNAEAEQKTLEARSQHAKKLESLGVLAGGIAHDFNNLLVGILGNADLALDDLGDLPETKTLVEDIRRASERASELTHRLLAYAGKAEIVPRTIDFAAVVEDTVALMRASLPKEARLELQVPANIWVRADPAQLGQVLLNLIANAADALEGREGTISIELETIEFSEVDLEARGDAAERSGCYASLVVADTGCGIPSDSLDKIFDPFFSTKFAGRGLGLSSLLTTVHRAGGTVDVDSQPSKGTRFRICLPLVAAPTEADVSDQPSSREGAELHAGGMLLIVDDDQAVRSVSARMVERLGFEAVCAETGPDALAIFSQRHSEVRCVLLDLTMPNMNGDEVFRELRRVDPGIPAIFMSGHSSGDLDGLASGAPGVSRMRKPFRSGELERQLRSLLG